MKDMLWLVVLTSLTLRDMQNQIAICLLGLGRSRSSFFYRPYGVGFVQKHLVTAISASYHIDID